MNKQNMETKQSKNEFLSMLSKDELLSEMELTMSQVIGEVNPDLDGNLRGIILRAVCEDPNRENLIRMCKLLQDLRKQIRLVIWRTKV